MRQRAMPLGIIIDGPGQEVRSSRVRSPDELALVFGQHTTAIRLSRFALFVDRCIAPASRIFCGAARRGLRLPKKLAAGPAKRQNSRPTFPPRMPPGRIQMAARQFSADRDSLATRHELWRTENARIALVSSQLPHGSTSC